MYTVLLVVHVLLAIGLITLVLFQHGKGADAGAAFGSGASGTVFGSRGSSNFLSRSTAVLATLFFVASLALAYLVNGPGGGSIVDQLSTQPALEQEIAPDAAPAQEPRQAPESVAPAVPDAAPSAGSGPTGSDSGAAQGQGGGADTGAGTDTVERPADVPSAGVDDGDR